MYVAHMLCKPVQLGGKRSVAYNDNTCVELASGINQDI